MVNKLYASRGGRQVYDILISETPSNTGRLAFHVEKGNIKTILEKSLLLVVLVMLPPTFVQTSSVNCHFHETRSHLRLAETPGTELFTMKHYVVGVAEVVKSSRVHALLACSGGACHLRHTSFHSLLFEEKETRPISSHIFSVEPISENV